MGQRRPHLIGIAGASGAGKSALAHAVATRLSTGPVVPVVPLDAYYRPVTGTRDTWTEQNFDSPEALDQELMATHLGRLAAGQAIDRPVYDFASHSRCAETARVSAGPFVVVEGLLSLYWETIRRLLGTRVYVTADDAVCLKRRVTRDVQERGRTEASVLAQWAATVRPMHDRYVLPTRALADLVVSGSGPLDETAARVVTHARTIVARG